MEENSRLSFFDVRSQAHIKETFGRLKDDLVKKNSVPKTQISSTIYSTLSRVVTATHHQISHRPVLPHKHLARPGVLDLARPPPRVLQGPGSRARGRENPSQPVTSHDICRGRWDGWSPPRGYLSGASAGLPDGGRRQIGERLIDVCRSKSPPSCVKLLFCGPTGSSKLAPTQTAS